MSIENKTVEFWYWSTSRQIKGKGFCILYQWQAFAENIVCFLKFLSKEIVKSLIKTQQSKKYLITW